MRASYQSGPESLRQQRPRLSRGYLALFTTVAIWSVPSLFQYYLNRYYDPWSQNFYRYSVACVAIVPFVYFQMRRGAPKIDLHAIRICLLPCIPNVVHQITQVIALFYMGPGVYAIFIRSTVIFTALLALIFFPEERGIIRQWQFQMGTVLGLIGAFGVIWFQAGSHDRHIALPGVAIAFTASFCWALYSTLIKRPSAQLGSVRSFGIISVITSALLLPLTFLFGKIATPLHVGVNVNLILIISAITCITIAHVLYYVAIQEIGVALAQTLQLLCPLGALALSAWIFGEHLTNAQMWSSAILLLGAFLAMRVKRATTPESAENL
jgi:drug/metabolite transporter (DMT)-like permease